MAYNNYFPNMYGYMPQQYQQPQQYQPPQQPQQYQQPQQQYTPPTIHAEIVQVNGEQEVKDYPLAAGATQMFMSKDDSCIFIKTAYANSPAQITTYCKTEPVVEPQPDYITREEFEKRLEEFFNS